MKTPITLKLSIRTEILKHERTQWPLIRKNLSKLPSLELAIALKL